MKDYDLTIVVVSTDSYSDLWPAFFECKQRFWSYCRYDTILVTNEMMPSFPSVKVIACGADAQWSDRTRTALTQISTRYVCFMLEDFFISKQIDEQKIEDAMRIMSDNSIKYYKLMSLTRFIGSQYLSYDFLQEITSTYPYGISLMPAIWDREFFLEKIGNGSYNPWKFEIDRLKEEQCSSNCIIGLFDKRNILNITHMVVQGQYLPPSFRKMKKLAIEGLNTERKTMSWLSYRKYTSKMAIGVLMRKHPFLNELLKPFSRFSVAVKYK